MRVNFRLSPSCQFFFHYEVTRIARVYKHAATNDNSLDLDPFNRKRKKKKKRTDSLVKVENSRAVPVVASSLSGKRVRLEFARPWVRFPAGLRCVFSSDPAVSSSIFVGAEREENLKSFKFQRHLIDISRFENTDMFQCGNIG